MKKVLLTVLCLSTSLLLSQNFKFGKVSKKELEEKMYPLDSSASAAYLYKHKKIFYEYDGDEGWRLITEVHERIKIYTKKGFDYATQSVNLYDGGSGGTEKFGMFKAYTYMLNNGKIKKEKLSSKNIFKEKNSKNWKTRKFTFSSISAGVVLEYKYRIESPYYTFIDDIILQHKIPVKSVNVVVKIPEYLVFKRKIKGYLFVDVKQRKMNRTIRYSYRQGGGIGTAITSKESGSVQLSETEYKINEVNVPALKDEPFVSNINNYRSECKFELEATKFPNSLFKRYAKTWEDVTKTIYESDSFGDELKKTSYYNDAVSTIVAEAKNEVEKIGIIFQYVKSKVKWNKNYSKYTEKGVRKAYKEGVGNVADINLMLTSMLRSVGLNANPVLISTRDNGVSFFPTIKGFNYVISAVVFDNGSYVLLDATERYSLPNVLPIRALNWEGRLIKKGGDSYSLPLKMTRHAVEDNTLSVKVTEEGMVEGMMRSKFTLHNALNYRKKYNHLKEENVISKFEEKYNIEIDNFRISNKQKLGKPIGQLMKFSSEDLIEEISGKTYITPMLFMATKTNPFKLENRKFPIDFATPWKDANRVSIQLPVGYTVEFVPEATAVELPEGLGVFKYQVKAIKNTISVISIVQINKSVITPQHYTFLKDFFKKIVEKQSEKIVLIKN